MLDYNVNWDDIAMIIWMILNILCMYAGYRWGHADGYRDGCRARRLAERQVRRMIQ